MPLYKLIHLNIGVFNIKKYRHRKHFRPKIWATIAMGNLGCHVESLNEGSVKVYYFVR